MTQSSTVCWEADWCVGEVLRHLENTGRLDNTLIIFTSDNGPVLQDGYVDYADSLIGAPRAGALSWRQKAVLS